MQRTWIARARVLIATLWVGSLWAIGYLAAPTLFATLFDRVLAGTIAGSLFRSESWLSVVCAILLLILHSLQHESPAPDQRKELRLIAAMLACTLIGYFALQPFMASLRETAATTGGVMTSDAKLQFGILHGTSMGIYLIESLLGVALILKVQRS
ncbi:MAG TPA: DUF4149 domain-containing protein [Burkholderiaceae bacterium]|jgi:hypothetical protein|nr:DUF4149 domain-containing protein [Burkholderiaceae bacterium]